MKILLKAIILSLLMMPAILSGKQKSEIEYNFVHDENFYSFQGNFIVRAELDCLISVIYNFEHISNYASGASSIELVQEGENWYDVTYTYRKLIIFENKSTWRRTLKRNEKKVLFEMISNKNNLKFMPEVLASDGYYQIKAENEYKRVEYFQECKLKPGLLKNAYIKQVKKEAIMFLYEFKNYIEKTCKFSNSTTIQ